jgi:glycosyltransferase involved in cell wall biosynthesis
LSVTAIELSVVIACKNEARRFGVMLDSLARQSWNGSWEVIVADNGSTDSTLDVVESYSERLSRLVLVDASLEPGYGPARNRGVERSTGSKILFVDADDEISDGYVAAMAAALDTAELVCARIGFDGLNSPWVQSVWEQRWQQDGPLNDFGFLPYAGSGTLGIRRSLFEEIGGFRHYERPSQFEEADFCWRIQLADHSAPVLVPGAVLQYRLPGTLRAWYRRGRNYARGQLVLYQLYGHRGMRQIRQISFRDLAGSVRRIRKLRDLARTAHLLGRLVGQRSGAALADAMPLGRRGGQTEPEPLVNRPSGNKLTDRD